MTDDRNSHEDADSRVCGAKTRKGTPCQRRPLKNGRCKLHGGAQPAPGPTHPNWKHGRYSRYSGSAPERIQERLQQVIDDPEAASLRAELGLMTALTEEKLAQLDGINVKAWEVIETLADELEQSLDCNDEREIVEECGRQLIASLRGAARQGKVIDEVAKMLEQRSRIAAREHKRMVDLDTMVRFDEFLARVVLMMGSVREHVTDITTVARIAAAWESWLGPIPGTIEITSASVSSGSGGAEPESGGEGKPDGGDSGDARIRAAFADAMRRVSPRSDDGGSESGGGDSAG